MNQQNVVYHFKCGLCDADYVGYTSRHLHQRVEKHKRSTIGNHIKEEHGKDPVIITSSFEILKKCQSKFDCLIFEMLFIRKLKPKLNKQCDSIRAKLFVWSFHFLISFIVFRVFLSFTLYFFLIFLYCSYVNILELFSQYLISPLTIVYKHTLILLFIMNLKMTVGRSKRRSFLTLIFSVKSVCKNLLIRITSKSKNNRDLTCVFPRLSLATCICDTQLKTKALREKIS